MPVRILLIQSWVVRTDRLRAQLAAAGYAARIYRVDFEAALHAALSRSDFDVVLYDPATPSLPRALVHACLNEHAIRTPLLDLVEVDTIGDQMRAALGALKN